MPLSNYFKGKGEKVMGSMKEQYGDEKGKSVFYAMHNKMKKKKGKKKMSAREQAAALKGGGKL